MKAYDWPAVYAPCLWSHQVYLPVTTNWDDWKQKNWYGPW